MNEKIKSVRVKVSVTFLIVFLAFSSMLKAQSLTGVQATSSASTTSTTFVTVGSASVTIDVTNMNYVYVAVTFFCQLPSVDNIERIGSFRIVDNSNPESINSGTFKRSLTNTKAVDHGIGSIVYIFDVRSLSGNKTYIFQHCISNSTKTLTTNATIVAIPLTTGVNTLNSNLKIATSVNMTDSWSEVTGSLTDAVTLPSAGGFYVAASIQSLKIDGSDATTGEWKLQYRKSTGGSWTDLGYSIQRSMSNTTDNGLISLVASLPDGTSADDYYFRVVQKRYSGTSTVQTVRCNIAAIELGVSGGYYFPVFTASKSSASTTSTTLTAALTTAIKPQSNTLLFLHSQFGVSSDGASDSPQFDIYVGSSTIGTTYNRYLSSSTDRGSGAALGLTSSLTSGTTYNVNLRHASTTGRTLTTSSILITGFGLDLSSATLTPVSISSTSGTSITSYVTLKAAFDDINAGTYQGNINIQIKANTSETAAMTLNTSGSGSANYTSVNIYPTVTGLSISGNLSTPLIDLNGADNVTIDGRVNGTGVAKDLIISNTSTSNSTSTSTIRFVGGAASNTVKYCTLNGSSTTASGGVLFFSSGGNNSNNLIDNNNITNSGGNRPINAIYSNGGSGFTNSGNTISNNNIYDFFNTGAGSQGIYIWSYSSDWSITGNNFYETTTLAPTGTFTYYTISIDGGSGNNFTVTDNFIGGSASDHTGTFTLNSTQSHTFYGLYLRVGTTTASSVQNNTIKSIASTSTSDRPFYGMSIYGGNVNIGTVTGNTIGSTTGNGSITLTNSTSNSTSSYGIYSTNGTADIQKNNIGSITTFGSAIMSHSFYGIYTAGSIYTISNNTIGSTDAGTTNSIWASSSTSGSQSINGISNSGSAIISGNIVSKLTNAATGTNGRMDGIASNNGTNTVTNNTVHDLTSALATTDEAVRGIYLYSSTAAAQTITGNTIYNLSNSNNSLAGYVTGIYYWGPTTASTVSKNFIYNLSVSASSTAATVYGIYIRGGAATYSNNMISLGGNTPTTIYGIYERGTAGNDNNLYFNTLYISGVPTSGTNLSYALYSQFNTNTRDFRNNILMNARTNGGATGKHYTAYFATSGSTGLTQNYNDYYATAAAGNFLGYFNGANVTTLDAWKIATGQDANSTNKSVTFVSATDLHLSGGSIGDGNLTGTPIDGITTDYFGNIRNVTYPYMGGNDVTNSPLPVLLASLNSVVDGRNLRLNWVTASEINNAGFEVERAVNRQQATVNWEKIGFVTGKGTTNTQTSYTFSDTKLNSGKYQYRLKQINFNGDFKYFNLNGDVEIGLPDKYELSQNYPNPFNPTTKIDFALPNDSKVSIKVYDMTGREVMNIMNNELKTAGYYTIKINPLMLSSGVYFYRMISDKFIETKKMAIVK